MKKKKSVGNREKKELLVAIAESLIQFVRRGQTFRGPDNYIKRRKEGGVIYGGKKRNTRHNLANLKSERSCLHEEEKRTILLFLEKKGLSITFKRPEMEYRSCKERGGGKMWLHSSLYA